MNVNVNGVFWCARAFGGTCSPPPRRRSSISARCRGRSATGRSRRPAYNVSKAAVHHLTRCLAAEWAPRGVRVNAVAPTYIETPMVLANPEAQGAARSLAARHADGPHGQADEVASAVLFLASDAASLVTGAILPVDGGYVCW